MPNLIIIIFNHIYPVFYVRFYCKGCVWEKVWRLKLLLKTKWILREDSREAIREVSHVQSIWLECEESWQLVFASNSWVRPSRETFCFAIFSYVLHYVFTHTIYTIIIHIINIKSAFQRENPKNYPWEIEIFILTIIYTILCGFPLLLPFHIHILERLIAQTLTTPNLSVKWGFGIAVKHWKKPSVSGCNRAKLRDPER